MDIGCQMYHADHPCTSSAYSCSYRCPEGGASSSSLRTHLLCSPLMGDEAVRPGGGGQSVAVDSMTFDGGAYTAWVMSGGLNDSDIVRSLCYNGEQRQQVVACRQDAYLHEPNDDRDPCPVFDVEYQRHACYVPASDGRTVLNVCPSIHAARLIDVDQHRAHDALMASNSQIHRSTPNAYSGAYRTYKQQSNYIENHRLHDYSPPEMLVNDRLDIRQRNNYNCTPLRAGSPRYGVYDYCEVQNGLMNVGSDTMLDSGAELCSTVFDGFRGPNGDGVLGRESPVEFSNSAMFTGVTHPSPSRLDVTAVLSPCLEAHELSLCSSVPLGAVSKTPRRSLSSSSSSSSSSTPNIIRRRLKTIAQSLDVRLASLGAPVHLRSRTSRHEPQSTHRKLMLTRSTSEPEALDRVAGVQRGSAGDDEYGFSSSCPTYRVRALRHQGLDDPSPTAFVGRPSADCARSSVDDAVTLKCSTISAKSPRSTTKSGSASAGSWLSSLVHKDNTLPKVRCAFLSQCINFKKYNLSRFTDIWLEHLYV